MKNILLVLLGVALFASSCRSQGPVEIGRASTEQITVRLLAVPVPMATHGEVVITSVNSSHEIARIRIIEATDLINDVRARAWIGQSTDLQVVVCLKDPVHAAAGPIYESSNGVIVMLVDSESGTQECAPEQDESVTELVPEV